MRRHLVTALLLAGTALVVGVDVARARPADTFTLEEHDRLVAEAPGCYAQCTAQGTRRQCVLKTLDCQVVCTSIPECKPDGLNAVKACAVVKSAR